MNLMKNIIVFFKRLFNKQKDIKMIEKSTLNVKKENLKDFKKQLEITKESKDNKNNNIETLICFGDGLGIQTKINY